MAIRQFLAKQKARRTCQYLRDKHYRVSDTIIISGNPRGGTTWLAEVLNSTKDTAMLWEPLNLTYERRPKVIGFGFRQFIPTQGAWPEAKEFMNDILSGKHCSVNSTQMLNKGQIIHSKRLIVKFCRANLMLPWIIENFNTPPPIHLMRHPGSVISSQINYRAWDNIKDTFVIPEGPFNEFYDSFSHLIAEVSSKVEKLALWWAIENQYLIKNTGKWHTVKYEDLLRNPEEEMLLLFEMLNLTPPKDLEKLIHHSSTTTISREKDIDRQLNKWKDNLSLKDINRIEEIVHKIGIHEYEF